MASKFRVTYKLTSAETEFVTIFSTKADLPEEALQVLQKDGRFANYVFLRVEKLE